MRLVELVPMWDKESAELEWRRIVGEQRMYSGESCVELPDGSVRWGQVNIRPLSNGLGHLEVIGSVTDVTDRVHERQLLRALVEARDSGEGFFRELLRRIALQLEVPYAYLVECDPTTSRCGQMLALWDDGRETPGSACGRLPHACPNHLDCAVDGECPRDAVAWLRTPAAERQWARDARVRVAVPMKGKSGRTLGFLGIMAVQKLHDPDNIVRVLERAAVSLAADVEHLQAQAEKRRIEAQLHQSQKMEALGALAGGIAHDFNNILTAVINYTALAKMDVASGAFSDAVGYLDEVERAALRARDLVKQILAFSRPDGRIADRELQPVELRRIAEEVLALVRPSAASSITIALEVERDLPPVLAVPAQMQQILLNLCVNALQAMKNRLGSIQIRLSTCQLPDGTEWGAGLAAGTYVRLSVKDQGCGIAPEAKDRIFDPFYTTKADEGGTGLGLAVVQGIVRQHAGAISVRTELERGTEFVVHLPAVSAPAVTAADGPICLVQGRGQRIMLVDDEPAALRSLGLLLQRQGFAVRSYANPEQALLEFWTAPDEVDLLITDLQMPLMTGVMLTEKVHAVRAGLPVILMSGHLKDVSPAELKKLNVAGVLAKPLLMPQLAETLLSVFSTVSRFQR
jgi:signal transduction histidine kinase/ActR/RegA family two-component response regulator